MDLHVADIGIDDLDEVNDERNELVLVQLFQVEVGDEEREVVALDGDPSQHDELFSAQRKEPRELLDEDRLEYIRLLDLERNAHRVD